MNLKRFLLMLVICVSSFMIYTNNVKADSCNVAYNNIFTNNATLVTSGNSGLIQKQVNFASSMSLNMNYDYIKIPMYAVLNSNGDTISNINLYETCSNSSTMYDNYTITYADGTQASIDEDNYQTICNQYYTNGSMYLPYEPTLQYITLRFHYGTSGWFLCELDNNLMATCRLPKNETQIQLNGYQLSFSLSKNASLIQAGFVGGLYYYCNDDSEDIKNGINSINDKLNQNNQTQQQIQNNTNEIKNDIKDSTIDNNNTSSSASSWSNKNATNGTITNLLTLPISLLQNILNGIQTSCSSFSLGTLFDTELILPCINLSDLIGSTLFNVIDLLFSGFMILNIAKKLIKIFNDFTNLKSNQIDEIYSNGGGAS